MTTRNLKLVLKRKWYDMIASGEKKEEYREIKPYWEKRLLNYRGILENISMIQMKILLFGYFDDCKNFPRGYKTVTFYLGYAKNRPSMMFKLKYIRFGKGKPEWGAEPGKEYFVIKLGERIK